MWRVGDRIANVHVALFINIPCTLERCVQTRRRRRSRMRVTIVCEQTCAHGLLMESTLSRLFAAAHRRVICITTQHITDQRCCVRAWPHDSLCSRDSRYIHVDSEHGTPHSKLCVISSHYLLRLACAPQAVEVHGGMHTNCIIIMHAMYQHRCVLKE